MKAKRVVILNMAKAVKMLLNEHILGCSLSNSELGKFGKSLRVYIMDGKGLVVSKMSGRCKVNAPAFKRMTVFVSKLTDAVMFQDFWWLSSYIDYSYIRVTSSNEFSSKGIFIQKPLLCVLVASLIR